MDEALSLPTSESSLTTGEENPATSYSYASKTARFLINFQQMGQDLTEQDIHVQDWLGADHDDLGFEHLDDNGIVNLVAGSSNDEVESEDESDDGDASEISATDPAISHKDAMVKFDECLTWLRWQPEAAPYNVNLLL